MKDVTIRQRLRYAFDNTMSRGTPALVAWLGLVTALLIVAFSAVVLITDFAPDDEDGRPGVIGQLFQSLLHALDPGTVAGDTGEWYFLLTMLLLTIGGLFVVSALIGVLATGIDSRLQELRKGRSFVIERDHTLILGWSSTVFTILSELAIANENETDPVVVILADRDKVEMEDAIRAKVGDTGRTRVVVRSGDPIDLGDLALANPQQARSMIVLARDEDTDPDAQAIKVVLALNRGPFQRREDSHVVAEITDPSNLEAARLVGGDSTAIVDKRETISRLIVQSSRQSGISLIYRDMLDFEGDEIYFRDAAPHAGLTYGEVLHAYEECSVIGIATDHSVTLNPPASTPLADVDSIIAIAEDDARLASAVPATGRVDEEAIVSPPRSEPAAARVLLLGWNGRGPAVVAELEQFARPGAELTVMADNGDPAGDIARECALERMALSVRHGNTSDRASLEALEPGAYDHAIVLCYSDALEAQRADARTLVTLLHLRDIASRGGVDFSIVSEMLDDRNRELAEVTKVDDVIVSDQVISLLLAQLSENAHLTAVFEELFGAEGAEIYLRPARDYVRAGAAVEYATIVESALRRGETAVGYRIGADAREPARGYGIRLNPPKSERLELADEDFVIVLAED